MNWTDKIKVTNEDCMDLMARYPDNYFDLAIVDPPYGIGECGGKNRTHHVKQQNGSKILVKDGNYRKKIWDTAPPTEVYFTELFRVSKHRIIWGANYFNYLPAGGSIVWDKVNDGSDQSDAEIAHTTLNHRVDIIRYMWRGMMQGKSAVNGTVQKGDKSQNENRIHPTQKPVELYRWLLKNYAKDGDKILDTHLGSGSHAIACHNMGFDLVACELDSDYYEASYKRFKKVTSQLQITF